MKPPVPRGFPSTPCLAGTCEQACILFSLVWPWELGLSVTPKADPSLVLQTLPLLYLQSLPLCWVHPLRTQTYSRIFYLEKVWMLTSAFSCLLSPLLFMEKPLEWTSLFPSSLVSNLLLQPWQQVKLSLSSVEPSVCGFPLLLPLPLPPLMLG